MWTHLRFLIIFCILAADLSVLVKSEVLHLEAPLDAIEWVVAQRWRQHGKVRFRAEHLEQVIADAREREVVVVALITCISSHEFNCRQARAGEEPAPNIVEEEAEAEQAVEAHEEVHQGLIQHKNVMLPDADDGDEHERGSNERVEDEKKEIALVLEADAVVSEQAIVAHLEYARLTDGAMVRSRRLELVADLALEIPEASQIGHSLRSVLHEPLDVLL